MPPREPRSNADHSAGSAPGVAHAREEAQTGAGQPAVMGPWVRLRGISRFIPSIFRKMIGQGGPRRVRRGPGGASPIATAKVFGIGMSNNPQASDSPCGCLPLTTGRGRGGDYPGSPGGGGGPAAKRLLQTDRPHPGLPPNDAEGDGLPGLIIDRLGCPILVIELFSSGDV